LELSNPVDVELGELPRAHRAEAVVRALAWVPSLEQMGTEILGGGGVLLAEECWVHAAIMLTLGGIVSFVAEIRRRRREAG
jgi:hypothetical protein